MELNPTRNDQMFPLVRLDMSFEKSLCGSAYLRQDYTKPVWLPIHHMARPMKGHPRFEKGRLIDVYA